MAKAPIFVALRIAVRQDGHIEDGNAADDEGGAEHVKDIREHEEPRRVPREMPQTGMLESRQGIEIGLRHQRSSNVLPLTTMRSARISCATLVDG